MRHSKHLWRAALILAGALVAGVLGRSLLVPASYGWYGPYRGADVEVQMNKDMHFGAPGSCAQCHADKTATHDAGPHKTVTCENCHAPLAAHIKSGRKIADMEKLKDASLCLRCHQRLEARPKNFPQIDPPKHLEEQGAGPMGKEVCFDCHDPHAPK